ncbi:hypothetical protein CWI42_110120 [Ordospora colligata]|uniref:Uncharacterized protein n=1 Tax=Ordospora colligata OC4 TaxID=1354746 RepID=A0A0B2UI00_9MICR|nr:uncharacterized protein M896_110010 [Ordospora colligata OC4]KHN68973.1 hypothetical protein M896_110010 [Ordospora colligata OC4]TBU14212.1 hypothetical protein CWI40_110120 [Ordospora colligata]TBU14248.1 hypothetical protein CWI41_110010 [Ordospora colligata]TBU17889.1 hypothetical protein CWI42_110120 [Ordospora colligata]
MLPKSVVDVYNELKMVALGFKSPAFRAFFTTKAEEDFNGIKYMKESKEKDSAVKKYLEEQGELKDVLKRQSVIYNMFYDDASRI